MCGKIAKSGKDITKTCTYMQALKCTHVWNGARREKRLQEGKKFRIKIALRALWFGLLCFAFEIISFNTKITIEEKGNVWHRYISVLYFSVRTIDFPVETATDKDGKGKDSRNPLKHYK